MVVTRGCFAIVCSYDLSMLETAPENTFTITFRGVATDFVLWDNYQSVVWPTCPKSENLPELGDLILSVLCCKNVWNYYKI